MGSLLLHYSIADDNVMIIIFYREDRKFWIDLMGDAIAKNIICKNQCIYLYTIVD